MPGVTVKNKLNRRRRHGYTLVDRTDNSQIWLTSGNDRAAVAYYVVSLHAFVDESKSRNHILVAVLIAPDHLQRARQTVNELRLSGLNRIHFTKERPDRRRQILRAILQLDMTIESYEVAQPRCLEKILRYVYAPHFS